MKVIQSSFTDSESFCNARIPEDSFDAWKIQIPTASAVIDSSAYHEADGIYWRYNLKIDELREELKDYILTVYEDYAIDSKMLVFHKKRIE